MNDIEVSSIDLVEGGNVFKQGHYLTLGYVPRDEKGETVDLSGKTLNVSLWGRKGVVFEAAATYSGGVIRFTFDKMVPAGDYTVEFTVTSSTDAKYRKKFPTNQHSGRIAIKQSADDLGVVGIQVYTVAQLKAEQKALLDAAVSGFTVDSETKMARVSGTTTHPTIGARLEADKQVLTQQLADIGDKVEGFDRGYGGTFNSLTDLQAAYPSGDTNRYVVAENGHWYYWNNATWVSGGVFQPTALGENSVGIEHLKFAVRTDVFDGKYINNGALVTNSTKFIPVGYPNAVVVIVELQELKEYTVSKGASDRFRVATYDRYPNREIESKRVIANYGGTAHPLTLDFTALENEKYAIIQISNTNEKPSISVIKHSVGRPIEDELFTATSENIFNGKYEPAQIWSSTGAYQLSGVGKGFSFPLEVGKTYYLKKFDLSDRFRIATYSQLVHDEMPIRYLINDDLGTEFSFTAETGENFAFIHVSNSNEEPKLGINVGKTPTNAKVGNLIPRSKIEGDVGGGSSGTNGEVSFEQLNFTTETDNLFSGTYENIRILASSGTFSFGSGKGFSFPLNESNKYYVKKFQQSDRFRVGTYEKLVENEPCIRYLVNDDLETEFSFVPRLSEKFAVVYVSNSGETPSLGITVGKKPVVGNNEELIPLSKMDAPKMIERPKLFGNFNGLYTTYPTEDITATLPSTQIGDIYNVYDALVSTFPEHISRKLLGYGSNITGEEDLSLPIYEYTISPPQNVGMNAGTTYAYIGEWNTATFLISTGVHGNEKHTVWSTYLFIKQMLENHKTNEMLMGIKSNVILKIIPIANPGGYNADTRENLKGVNINRNFSYGFVLNESPGNNSGSAPYSEIETRLLRDWFIENRRAHAFIDVHGFYSSLGESQLSYFISSNQELDNLYSSLMRTLSYKWKDKYLAGSLENEAYGYVNSKNYKYTATTVAAAYHEFGIDLSGTIEIRFSNPNESGIYTKGVIEPTVELIGNYTLALLNRFFT